MVWFSLLLLYHKLLPSSSGFKSVFAFLPEKFFKPLYSPSTASGPPPLAQGRQFIALNRAPTGILKKYPREKGETDLNAERRKPATFRVRYRVSTMSSWGATATKDLYSSCQPLSIVISSEVEKSDLYYGNSRISPRASLGRDDDMWNKRISAKTQRFFIPLPSIQNDASHAVRRTSLGNAELHERKVTSLYQWTAGSLRALRLVEMTE